ncbi:hypothetical protein [Ferviditalea candida]|uniref:Uncharacterized protein n=1 Tax=Ferviditalea candida TaxID=3108399 RepID=A0ABU5ZKL1_9BACL|nr:hypothetical protein [Paenibacillaceae bacterium T2]
MPKRKRRQGIKIIADYMIVDGEVKQIDPFNTPGLADRCKLAWAEMITGVKHEIVSKGATP